MSSPTQPNTAPLYTQGFGSSPSGRLNSAVVTNRAPTTSDIAGAAGNYPIGQRWIDQVADTSYSLTSVSAFNGVVTATWVADGGGTSALATLTGDTGTATPTAGNIQIAGGAGVVTSATGSTVTIALEGGSVGMDSFVPDAGTNPVVPTALGAVTMAGTANQITTTGGLNTLTFSVPATFIAPGSMASTTTTTAGTGLTVTTGGVLVSGGDIINAHSDAGTDVTIEVTNSDNTNAASRGGVEIATGGSSSGDPYLSFQISGVGASTMTMGLDNSASDLFVISNSTALGTSNALTLSQAGALTTTTTLTATLGNITATNGNLAMGAAGNKIIVPTGANASAGISSAMTAGAVTVATTACSATALVFYSRAATGGTTGDVSITAQDATGFTLTSSSNTETSNFNWWIINL